MEKIAEHSRSETSKEIYYLIMVREDPEFKEIPIPLGKVSPLEAKKFEIDCKMQQEKRDKHQTDKFKCFGIILGECKDLTKEVAKADKSFRGLERADDVVDLLKLLGEIC